MNNADLNVGHAFVGFEKNNSDGTNVRQTFGFYPGGSGIKSKGIIMDDGGHEYDVSYTITVSQTQFNNALSGINSTFINAQYLVNSYNCTDAAINWMNSAGANLIGVPRGVFNNTPGDFGQALRQKPTANKNGSNAINSKGKCN